MRTRLVIVSPRSANLSRRSSFSRLSRIVPVTFSAWLVIRHKEDEGTT